MQQLVDLSSADEQVFQKLEIFLSVVRTTIGKEPEHLEAGIATLERLRQQTYEELNQIQHEAMIIRAARFLEVNELGGKNVQWYWNPRQTGTKDEPDLRGIVAERTEVSAEITASENPNGAIDKRMRATLEKLSKMPGKKLYFVRTKQMENRAITKVAKAGYQIGVRRI